MEKRGGLGALAILIAILGIAAMGGYFVLQALDTTTDSDETNPDIEDGTTQNQEGTEEEPEQNETETPETNQTNTPEQNQTNNTAGNETNTTTNNETNQSNTQIPLTTFTIPGDDGFYLAEIVDDTLTLELITTINMTTDNDYSRTVLYNDGHYYAIAQLDGVTSYLLESTDLASWSLVAEEYTGYGNLGKAWELDTCNDKLIASFYDTSAPQFEEFSIITSTDGVTWNTSTYPGAKNLGLKDGKNVACGEEAIVTIDYYSIDNGATWNDTILPQDKPFSNVLFDGTQIVAFQTYLIENGQPPIVDIYTTTDGSQWNLLTSIPNAKINGPVAYYDGTIVVSASFNDTEGLYTTTDYENWDLLIELEPPCDAVYGLVYEDNALLASIMRGIYYFDTDTNRYKCNIGLNYQPAMGTHYEFWYSTDNLQTFNYVNQSAQPFNYKRPTTLNKIPPVPS